MNNKSFLVFGLITAAIAVLLGAFAAHGLKHHLTPYQLGVFETGVRYQMYHSIAIVMAVLLQREWSLPATGPIWCFCAGIIGFSGSLYLLALTGIKWFGPVTPIGGICFIAGWVWLAIIASKQLSESKS